MEIEKEINERTYRIKQYRMHERIVFHARVAKLFGVGATIADGIIDGFVDDDLTLDKIGFGDAIKNITDKIDPEIHAKFIEDTIGKLTVEPVEARGESKKFEQYFTDNFKDVYPLFMEIVEFNIEDALSENLKKKLMSYVTRIFDFMEEQAPESEQTSTNKK